MGTGKFGACCTEMNIWEANNMATTLTPRVCSKKGRCSGAECDGGEAGWCDEDGCDYNPYRLGDTSFLGLGKTVNTSALITVITQFVTSDNTTSGALREIRRIYVQNGKVIQNSKTHIPGTSEFDSITDKFCSAQKDAFGDPNIHANKGGLEGLGKAFENGMVLVMSIGTDHKDHMLWLDSSFPLDKDPSAPGVTRGACDTSSGEPLEVESAYRRSFVSFSNIKYGSIGSTYTLQ
jgi:cellulose 1,4-beta-cellobiosidase